MGSNKKMMCWVRVVMCNRKLKWPVYWPRKTKLDRNGQTEHVLSWQVSAACLLSTRNLMNIILLSFLSSSSTIGHRIETPVWPPTSAWVTPQMHILFNGRDMYQQTSAKFTINSFWFTIKIKFYYFWSTTNQLWSWEPRMHNHARTTKTNHQISKRSVQETVVKSIKW